MPDTTIRAFTALHPVLFKAQLDAQACDNQTIWYVAIGRISMLQLDEKITAKAPVDE